MKKMLEILTPENVHLEFELAGLGSRFVAMLIDSLIQGGMLLVAFIAMVIAGLDFNNLGALNPNVMAIGIIVLFIIWFGYFIFFEMLMNGQTPGKKVAKLRVIRQTGEPIGFFDSFLRNLLRIADMLPSIYLVGAVFILFSKRYKRIGDFAANTVVVKVRKESRPVDLESLIKKYGSTREEMEKVNIYPVNNFEYGILKEFLERKDHLGARKPVFLYHLNNYFSRKFNFEEPHSNPEQFFEEIIRMNSGV